MSLRIAMICAAPYPAPQGSQVFLRDNARALRSRGHEVHLLVYGYGTGPDPEDLRVHRCRRLPGMRRTQSGPTAGKVMLDALMVGLVKRVVREERIDVVYAHNYEALLVALAARCRPIIYHAHNAMSDELPYYVPFKGPAEWVGRWLDRTFPRRADRVCVPHRRLAGHLILRGCDHARMAIVPPPVDAAMFEVAERGTGRPPVLYAGNLDPYQNLEMLFAAMKRVRRKERDAQLLIGTAVRTEFLEAEVAPTPGFDSLRQFLKRDAIFVVPRVSWSGYPIKLLNAMAAGLGIVACESAAYPLTPGINGLVVPDNDPASCAEAVLQLMRDHKLRATLGQHARETIEKEHQPAAVAEALEELALEVAGK